MPGDRPEAPPLAALGAALHVRRNVVVGVVLGVALGVGAYLVRVLELFGPVAGTREYPVFGVSGWFLMLAFVLAVTSGLLFAAALTAVSAVRLIHVDGPPLDGEREDDPSE